MSKFMFVETLQVMRVMLNIPKTSYEPLVFILMVVESLAKVT